MTGRGAGIDVPSRDSREAKFGDDLGYFRMYEAAQEHLRHLRND